MTEFHKKTSEALIVLRSNKIRSNQKAALNTNEKQVGIIWMFLRFAEYVSICLTNFNNQKPANSSKVLPRVSVQGVESLWGDCRFIPADWGSQ